MQSYLLLVDSHQLSNSSDEEDISNEEVDALIRISHGVLAASFIVYDRSSVVGRTSGHNSFTATTGVPRRISKNIGSRLQYLHFTPEVILHSVVKYTNEEAYREGQNDFDLSMCELVVYCSPVYQRTHLLHFLCIKLTVF